MPGKYQSVTLTSTTVYPAQDSPQVSLEFQPDGYLFNVVNAAADAVVAVSFDGVNDWMMLRCADATKTQGRSTKLKKVWLKKISGTGAITVDVTAGSEV